MFKMIFKYWDDEKTWCQTTLHGGTKAQVYAKARQWSLKASPENEGNFTILALYHYKYDKDQLIQSTVELEGC